MVAGHGGGDRLITWSHVCDLPDPWAWVRPGYLLLTTGDGLPAEPAAQADGFGPDRGRDQRLVLAPRPGARPVGPLDAARRTTADRAPDRGLLAAVHRSRPHRHRGRRPVRTRPHQHRPAASSTLPRGLAHPPDLLGRLDVVGRSIGWSITVVRSVTGAVIATAGRAHRTRRSRCPSPAASRSTCTYDPTAATARRLPGALPRRPCRYRARGPGPGPAPARRGEPVLRGTLDGTVGAAQLRYELPANGTWADTPLTLAQFITVTTPLLPRRATGCPAHSRASPTSNRSVADDGGGRATRPDPRRLAGPRRVPPQDRSGRPCRGLSAAFVAPCAPPSMPACRLASPPSGAVENNRISAAIRRARRPRRHRAALGHRDATARQPRPGSGSRTRPVLQPDPAARLARTVPAAPTDRGPDRRRDGASTADPGLPTPADRAAHRPQTHLDSRGSRGCG